MSHNQKSLQSNQPKLCIVSDLTTQNSEKNNTDKELFFVYLCYSIWFQTIRTDSNGLYYTWHDFILHYLLYIIYNTKWAFDRRKTNIKHNFHWIRKAVPYTRIWTWSSVIIRIAKEWDVLDHNLLASSAPGRQAQWLR